MSVTHTAHIGITIKTLTRVGDHIRPETWYVTLADQNVKNLLEHIDTEPLQDSDGKFKIFHVERVLSTEYSS